MHHKGEISRNPYHVTLPAFMIDCVRRGSERVGGPGVNAVDFQFATIYQLMRWREGQLTPALSAGKIIGTTQNCAAGIGLAEIQASH